MEGRTEPFDVQIGDHVVLASDDWNTLGQDLVLVDAEPVSGSTQCVVRDGTDIRFVSRFALRRR